MRERERENFLARVRESVARYDPEWVLLNFEAMGEVDLTGADALETLRAELADKGIVLALARLKQDPREVPSHPSPISCANSSTYWMRCRSAR